MSAWSCRDLWFRYPGGARPALQGVSLEIPAERLTAIIGPNGSGKSTLLRALLGTVVPERGEARFRGRPVLEWSRPEMARAVGVVPQGEEIVFPIPVREVVAMGRYPHLGAWRRERPEDSAAIAGAMRRCGIEGFEERRVAELSGGEQQRTRIARALAQEPGALALDEPTASLDVAYEMSIFELMRELRSAGKTVLLVTHNLNLAARYADRMVLLDAGRVVAEGSPAEVLTADRIGAVYRWPVEITAHGGTGVDAGAPQVVPLSGGGRGGEGGEHAA